MFTWEANAKSPTFLGTCGAENQIGCVLLLGIWPKVWKANGRNTGTLEANSPPRVCSGHSAIRDAAAKTEAPSFTNDIVRSSCKLQIAAGEKPEAEEFRGSGTCICSPALFLCLKGSNKMDSFNPGPR
jgi:hypothetical protein